VTGLNDPLANDEDPTLTADGLDLCFMSDRSGNKDLWCSRRASLSAAWDAPTAATELNTTHSEATPALSQDGLRMWFYTARDPAGIWLTTRSSRADAWGAPAPVAELESTSLVFGPALDPAELRMALAILDGTTQSWDLFLTQRDSPTSPWAAPVTLPELNTESRDFDPFLYPDQGGWSLLFSSDRSGGGDLFWAHRVGNDAPFSAPEPLTELNDATANETDPVLSTDGQWMLYASNLAGSSDLYEVTRVVQ